MHQSSSTAISVSLSSSSFISMQPQIFQKQILDFSGVLSVFAQQHPVLFQSIIDMLCSLVLVLLAALLRDAYKVHFDGGMGLVECAMWNSRRVFFGPFVGSTWNLVCLTIER